jgi:hypothetical protein
VICFFQHPTAKNRKKEKKDIQCLMKNKNRNLIEGETSKKTALFRDSSV